MKKKLSLIVPCYNEEEAFPIFYKEVVSVVSKMKYDYELILVNDGSRDHTLDLMKEVALKDNHVKYLSFSRNFGKESAMYAGFCAADGDYIAVMDADMQDPPSLLPEMMKQRIMIVLPQEEKQGRVNLLYDLGLLESFIK